jgi:NDP-sugar pyrophosphorylase family protein
MAGSAIVEPGAQLRGCTVVGANCRVGAETVLEDTILWPNADIASQSRLEACIVRSRKKVSGIHRNIDI